MSISIRDLVLVYGTGASAVTALHGLELDVADGEFCIVRGPNGSGKTSLIRVLTGELRPSAGQVRVSAAHAIAPQIGVVRQFDDLDPALTVAEHCRAFSGPQALLEVPEPLRARRVAELTAGERRIVAIALALGRDPDVLLADEPTGALPWPEAQALLQHLAARARERGVTVLLVSHDRRAEAVADRVVSLSDGRIGEEWPPGGTPRQVVDSRGWLRLPGEVRAGLARLLQAAIVSDGVSLRGERTPMRSAAVQIPAPVIIGGTALRYKELGCVRGGSTVFSGLAGEIASGARVAVTGPSGSGKTTLLEVLAGLRAPDGGSVERVGSTTGTAFFSMDLPLAERCSLAELGVDAAVQERLQLNAFAQRELRTLSGGQRQRALIAIALAHPASVLLLDDPTSALDDEHAALVVDAIATSEKTIVMATHDPRLLDIASGVIALDALPGAAP